MANIGNLLNFFKDFTVHTSLHPTHVDNHVDFLDATSDEVLSFENFSSSSHGTEWETDNAAGLNIRAF